MVAPAQGNTYSGAVMRLRRKPDWETEFAAHLRGRNLSPDTIETYCWGIRAITAWTAKDIWEIHGADLLAFLESGAFKPRTAAQILVSAKAGYRWAVGRQLCKPNGVLEVQAPKLPKRKRKPPLSHTTARALLTSSRTILEMRVVYFGLYAGTRISESARMDSCHRYGTDRLRFVGKGDIERDVPIHPELAKVLPVIFSRKPPALSTLNVTMQRLRDRIGATDVMGHPATAHTLRRTCGTTMYRGGALWEVSDTVLGHSLPVGDSYIEIDFSRLVEAVNLIDYFADGLVQLSLF